MNILKKTYTTEKEFIKYCPCAWSVISFAESFNTPEIKWSFRLAKQDLYDKDCYRAEFDASTKECLLEIECRIMQDKHHCKVITKVDKTSYGNDHISPQS